MAKHFKYKSLEDLEASRDALGASYVRFEPDAARVRTILGRPVPVGPVQVGNSLAIHPMEGCDGEPDGRPGELTWRRYGRFGRGGAKLVWFEATAVRADGRANPRQLWITPENWGEFASLLEMTRRVHREEWGRDDDLLIPIQLTHSGRYSVSPGAIAYHHPAIDQKTRVSPDAPVMPDAELERLEDDYVRAARLAWNAGFRAVDLKVTHGYLLSELLGAKTREGRYGGPLANRTRFITNVLAKLRSEFNGKLLLAMRLGCFDGVPYEMGPDRTGVPMPFPTPYPYGFGVDRDDPLREDLSEVKEAIRGFREAGLALLNISLGCPYYNPHLGRPFETPDEGNYEQPEHPMLGVDRHFRIAGALQSAFPDLPVVGTGYSWLQKYAINAGAWNLQRGNVTFLGIGRGALAYPDFARDALAIGALDERRVCKTLTYCTFLMRQKNHPLGQWPTGCPPFDKEAYGPIIKEVRAVQRASKPFR